MNGSPTSHYPTFCVCSDVTCIDLSATFVHHQSFRDQPDRMLALSRWVRFQPALALNTSTTHKQAQTMFTCPPEVTIHLARMSMTPTVLPAYGPWLSLVPSHCFDRGRHCPAIIAMQSICTQTVTELHHKDADLIPFKHDANVAYADCRQIAFRASRAAVRVMASSEWSSRQL